MADSPYQFTLIIVAPDAKNVFKLEAKDLGQIAEMIPLGKVDPVDGPTIPQQLVKLNAPLAHEVFPEPTHLFGTFTVNLSMYNPDVTDARFPRPTTDQPDSDDRKR